MESARTPLRGCGSATPWQTTPRTLARDQLLPALIYLRRLFFRDNRALADAVLDDDHGQANRILHGTVQRPGVQATIQRRGVRLADVACLPISPGWYGATEDGGHRHRPGAPAVTGENPARSLLLASPARYSPRPNRKLLRCVDARIAAGEALDPLLPLPVARHPLALPPCRLPPHRGLLLRAAPAPLPLPPPPPVPAPLPPPAPSASPIPNPLVHRLLFLRLRVSAHHRPFHPGVQ